MSVEPTKNPFTLNRYILTEQKKYPNAKGDLSLILNSIALSCKIISSAAQGAGIYSLYGLSGEENASGDEVKKLDVFSNDCMINTLEWSGKIGIMVSEEMEESIIVEDCEDPKYCVMFDPLDGSSNIDANVSVGTIFCVSRCSPQPSEKDLLQTGENIVCAGYCMYGDASMLVLTFGDTVQGFTLDPQIGEFIHTHRDIRIPTKGKIYSVNEGNARTFDPVIQAYLEKCKNPRVGKPKKARYIGSMVADIHRTLLYGGVFMYPASKSAPNGKLRLIYELNPMAFIMKAAGGKASTGREPVLKVVPDHIHCRAPVFMGSAKDVDEIDAMYAAYYKSQNQDENKNSQN